MIDLTPLDVRKKKADFRRGLRGYDIEEVDAFLDLAAERGIAGGARTTGARGGAGAAAGGAFASRSGDDRGTRVRTERSGPGPVDSAECRPYIAVTTPYIRSCRQSCRLRR